MVATCIYKPLGNGNHTEKEAPSGTTYYAWDPQDRLVALYKPSQRTRLRNTVTKTLRSKD